MRYAFQKLLFKPFLLSFLIDVVAAKLATTRQPVF